VIIGQFLPALKYLDRLDSVWVLWVPDHLTVWSRKEQGWKDFIFSAFDPDAAVDAALMEPSVLQAAESRFLEMTGVSGGSPYRFELSAGRDGVESDP
jgi:hypothetical protein